MPYVSDSQRRWAHTESGKKALGGPEGVNEWDQASKGKKLPEHVAKAAEGGVIEDWAARLRDYFMNPNAPILHDKNEALAADQITEETNPYAVQPSTGSASGYAYGGMPGPQGPQFDASVGLPPAPPMGPPPPQSPPVAPNMPASIASPIQNYLGAQKAQMGRYGPEQQLAVAQDIAKRRSGAGNVLPQAMGGLADAIMQGVSRAGPSNFQQNITNQQNLRDTAQMGALEKAGTQNIAQTEMGMKMDAQDPRSALSKSAQAAWGSILAQNGFKPEQVAQMSAANIAAITGQSVEALKAKAEAEMARATLGLKGQQLGQEVKHQTVQEQQSAADLAAKVAQENMENKRKAGEELGKHPFQRMLGILPGQKGLESQLSGIETPQPAGIFADAEKEARYQAWKQSQGK